MNSPQFQNLSNEGSIDLQDQSDNLAKQKVKEAMLRDGTRSERSHYSTAASEPERADAEAGIDLSLTEHGLALLEQQRLLRERARAALAGIPRSPEASASAAAASSSTPYQPYIAGTPASSGSLTSTGTPRYFQVMVVNYFLQALVVYLYQVSLLEILLLLLLLLYQHLEQLLQLLCHLRLIDVFSIKTLDELWIKFL